MNVLLIEDDKEKAKSVISFLRKEYPNVGLEHKESYNSGLREIINNSNLYDIILLDMTMSTFDISTEEDGGVPQILAGGQILDAMSLRCIVKPVVVVSMYVSFGGVKIDDLDKNLRTDFPEIYKGYVRFAINKNDWQDELRKYISNINFK